MESPEGIKSGLHFNLTLGAIFMPYATTGTESKHFLWNHMLPGAYAENRKIQPPAYQDDVLQT